jgi:hypothetical protein
VFLTSVSVRTSQVEVWQRMPQGNVKTVSEFTVNKPFNYLFCLSWYNFSWFSSETETPFNYNELGGTVNQQISWLTSGSPSLSNIHLACSRYILKMPYRRKISTVHKYIKCSEFLSRWGQEFWLLHIVKTGSGAHWAYFPGVKRPQSEADHSSPSSADVKKTWIYASSPPYVFMDKCLVKYRNNFTSTLTYICYVHWSLPSGDALYVSRACEGAEGGSKELGSGWVPVEGGRSEIRPLGLIWGNGMTKHRRK